RGERLLLPVAPDPVPEALRLADVDDLAAGVLHEVHAGSIGQVLEGRLELRGHRSMLAGGAVFPGRRHTARRCVARNVSGPRATGASMRRLWEAFDAPDASCRGHRAPGRPPTRLRGLIDAP